MIDNEVCTWNNSEDDALRDSGWPIVGAAASSDKDALGSVDGET